MKTLTLFHIASVLFTGLVAGLFYGYQCSVNKGLGNLTGTEYLKGFQSINRAIQNPVFFLSFIGSIIFLAVAAILSYRSGQIHTFYFLLAAFIIHLLGVFGITLFGNVPLNERLDAFDIANASEAAITEMRDSFETPWNRLHRIRTAFSIVAFLLSILSLRAK
jgi:uncharacterized membrane protein